MVGIWICHLTLFICAWCCMEAFLASTMSWTTECVCGEFKWDKCWPSDIIRVAEHTAIMTTGKCWFVFTQFQIHGMAFVTYFILLFWHRYRIGRISTMNFKLCRTFLFICAGKCLFVFRIINTAHNTAVLTNEASVLKLSRGVYKS